MGQTAMEQKLLEEIRGLPEERLAEVLDFVRFIRAKVLEESKIEQALELYLKGRGSIGYVAELVGVSKRELIREARKRGIEPEFSEETFQEELA